MKTLEQKLKSYKNNIIKNGIGLALSAGMIAMFIALTVANWGEPHHHMYFLATGLFGLCFAFFLAHVQINLGYIKQEKEHKLQERIRELRYRNFVDKKGNPISFHTVLQALHADNPAIEDYGDDYIVINGVRYECTPYYWEMFQGCNIIYLPKRKRVKGF